MLGAGILAQESLQGGDVDLVRLDHPRAVEAALGHADQGGGGFGDRGAAVDHLLVLAEREQSGAEVQRRIRPGDVKVPLGIAGQVESQHRVQGLDRVRIGHAALELQVLFAARGDRAAPVGHAVIQRVVQTECARALLEVQAWNAVVAAQVVEEAFRKIVAAGVDGDDVRVLLTISRKRSVEMMSTPQNCSPRCARKSSTTFTMRARWPIAFMKFAPKSLRPSITIGVSAPRRDQDLAGACRHAEQRILAVHVNRGQERVPWIVVAEPEAGQDGVGSKGLHGILSG
jgi:hypothetical protein